MRISRIRKITIVIFFIQVTLFCNDFQDFNTRIMNSTCKIQGENGNIGTAFFIGTPTSPNSDSIYFTLVTAKHVLDGLNGDNAIIYLRREKNGVIIKYPHEIKIRNNGKNNYVSHPTEDVSAINIPLSKKAYVDKINIAFLANDSIMKSIDIHPGDELYMFGYPLGYEANEAGYPILRSGKIASYPILPSSIYKTFLLDIDVFKGNSGGPVVFYEKNRYIKDEMSNKYYNFIAGLVSQEGEHWQYTETLNEEKIIKTKLSIAIVVQAKYILETIQLLKSENK